MKIAAMARTIACVVAAGFPLVAFAGPALDSDSDGVVDVLDNCALVANAGALGCDVDSDGYGNACDCNLEAPGAGDCNFGADFAVFLADFSDSGGGGAGPWVSDFECNGDVNFGADFAAFLSGFAADGAAMTGPGFLWTNSGLSCAGTPPCS